MISRIKVYNRWSMDRVAEKGPESGFPFCGKAWALVSIHTDAGDEGLSAKYLTDLTVNTLVKIGMVRHMSLRFWDITDDPKLLDSLNEGGFNYELFDEDMAKKVVAFVDDLIAIPEEIVLVAHCDAGVSRSGAVAQFAAERAGLNMEDFWIQNPSLHPNPFVKRMLRKEAGVELMSAEDVKRQKAADAAMDKLIDMGAVFV